MDFNFLEYFYTDKYDNEIIIKDSNNNYSVREIKEFISSEVRYLSTLETLNIVITAEDYFSFIIIFLSCIFANKNIYITNNNNLTKSINDAVNVDTLTKDLQGIIEFPEIDRKKSEIIFFTSGTTSQPKIVKKNLECLFAESKDLISVLDFGKDKKLEFITTTPINHLFAMTAYIFLGLNSQNIMNTERINYAEDLNIENAVLVTSPSFLSYLKKHDIIPEISPKRIISAGAKLEKDIQEYCEKFSKILNIYGSTETGTIAYKTKSSEQNFRLFDGIKIISATDEKTVIQSEYSYENTDTLNDRIIQNSDNTINITGRSDRIFKIQEKRVSAAELEKKLKSNPLVKNVYLINSDTKIKALTALSKKGAEFLINNGTYALIKNLKADLAKDFSIIPQKWKFIDEIPVNAMGKYDTEKINEIFSVNLSLPFIIKREINSDNAEFELFFYRNCNFFKGHFDKHPIVPGVVQLFYAAYFAKISFNLKCETGQIKRVKFSNIINPDKIIKLKLTKTGKVINYEYFDDTKTYSSGSLPIENIFQGVNT